MARGIWLIIFMLVLALSGCSRANDAVGPGSYEDVSIRPGNIGLAQADRWNWGMWVFDIDETHSRVEMIPWRESNLHYNVTSFVEGPPCPNCLATGPIQPKGDGTFKIDVTLKHPFPGMPRYTGFDVRGVVIFPATHHWYLWEDELHLMSYLPGDAWEDPNPYTEFSFSRAEQGGGQLLNADGYSYYFSPSFPQVKKPPICNYQKGKFAIGNNDELDSTVNPYLQFQNIEERRIFTCDAVITRTYHIQPPQGAFKFGYVVDASWVPPTKTPVTNPAKDFPDWANAEDGYTLGVQQVKPISKQGPGTDHKVIEWKLRHNEACSPEEGLRFAYVLAPGLWGSDDWINFADVRFEMFGKYVYLGDREIIDPWTTIVWMDRMAGVPGTATPGHYLGLCLSGFEVFFDGAALGKAYFRVSPTFDFVDLYVEP